MAIAHGNVRSSGKADGRHTIVPIGRRRAVLRSANRIEKSQIRQRPLFVTRMEIFVDSSLCVFSGIAVIGFCVARTKLLWLFPAFLTLGCCFAQEATLAPGSIAGEVFNIGADGQRRGSTWSPDNSTRLSRASNGIGCNRAVPL